jgi:hypothetical protein
MVKLGKIRRAAVLSVGLSLISSIFVIGSAPSARADDFQYTVTFDTFNAYGMYTSFSFDTTSLLGTTNVSIDPSDVHIIAAPNSGGDVTYNTESLTASSSGFRFSLIGRSGPDPCAGAFTNFNCINTWGTGEFTNPITSPGTYQFDFVDLSKYVIGGGLLDEVHTPQQYDLYSSNVSVILTPEPNSGLMFGGCFLLCAGVALRRKLLISWRTIPKPL